MSPSQQLPIMTERFFYQDPYAAALNATITAVDGEWVALDRTVFYPQGGGQPGDTGWMGSADRARIAVVDTRKGRDGAIWHRLEGDSFDWSAGQSVELELDWKRRYRHMRMHTCLHLLGSLVPCGVTGAPWANTRAVWTSMPGNSASIRASSRCN